MIFDLESWREIGATLAQNKSRSLLTAFGVFWGTTMLALLLGGSKGFKSFMSQKFEGFATNSAILSPNRTTKPYKGFNKGLPIKFTDLDVAMLKAEMPAIDHISSISATYSTAKYSKKSVSASMVGVESDYSNLFSPIIYSGRFLNTSDDAGNDKVCVIGIKIAQTLFGVGEALGKQIAVDNIYYKVVGVAGQTSEINIPSDLNESVIVSNNLFRKSYNKGDQVDFIIFSVASPGTPAMAEPAVRRIISRNHPVAPDDVGAVFFMDIAEQFKMVDNLFFGITLLALFVGAGTLLSGIIGVGNIMWIVVRERTQEIGVRRALGARPRQIIIQILSEGILLTLVAGIAGICFAAVILAVVEFLIPGIRFQMTFANAIEIMAVFVILGSCAGLIPAIRAMKIKPIEALNSK